MNYIVKRNGHIIDASITRNRAIMHLENFRRVALSAGIGVTVRGVGDNLKLIAANGVTWEVISS